MKPNQVFTVDKKAIRLDCLSKDRLIEELMKQTDEEIKVLYKEEIKKRNIDVEEYIRKKVNNVKEV